MSPPDWGADAVRCHRMEFIRLMKNQISPAQRAGFLSCRDQNLSLVHIKKFPEGMALSLKDIPGGVFKIMDGNHLRDFQLPPQVVGR